MNARVVLFTVAILALTAPALAKEETAALPSEGSPGQTLKLGEKIKLDGLGPAIVNEDGTLKRITNWDKLTPREQALVHKRLNERNKERLDKLRTDYSDGIELQEDDPAEASKLNKEDHLRRYVEALKALNTAVGGNPLEASFMSGAATKGKDKDGNPKLDLTKLQETLEKLQQQQDLLPKTEL